MGYTDDELLDALRAFADEHGRPPTAAEINDAEALPSAMMYDRRFGSWNAAVEAAGLTSRLRRRSEDELLNALREFADEHGRPPKQTEANDDDALPSVSVFVTRFESWNAAVEKAGFTPHKPRRSDEELLADLRAFADQTGTQPTTIAVREREDMANPVTYYERFGSWNTAVEQAGFVPYHRRRFEKAED